MQYKSHTTRTSTPETLPQQQGAGALSNSLFGSVHSQLCLHKRRNGINWRDAAYGEAMAAVRRVSARGVRQWAETLPLATLHPTPGSLWMRRA